MSESVGTCLHKKHSISTVRPYIFIEERNEWESAHFSNSAKSRVSNVSSQPTSTSIFIPPSSSKIDCDAFEEDDCAPSSGVNVNIFAVSTSLVQLGGAIGDCRPDGVEFVATTRQRGVMDSG